MIQIELQPEVEAQLTAQARAQGMDVQAYVESLLHQALGINGTSGWRRPTTAESKAFFEAMASMSEKIPQLPDEAFRRESFYQDHD
jgi:post-segregation antitoxin (ccd killing protein)